MKSQFVNRFFNGAGNKVINFPFLSPALNLPILQGLFDYNESFDAFLKGTAQKKETALVVGYFAKKLQEAQIQFTNQEPIEVADLGCADSFTCLEYLKKMNYEPGFNYLGIDTNQKFLQEANIKLSNEGLIKKYTLMNDNALSGCLAEKEALSSLVFDLIFVSHTAYYIKDLLSGRNFLEDINKLLAKESGIAIFLHEDSTYYFRSTYNPNQFNTISAPALLEKSAEELTTNSIQLTSINFHSKLHFSHLEEELWEHLKTPSNYSTFADNPAFVDTLKKLAFIVQCDLKALAERGSLSPYIDDIKTILQNNDNCLNLQTCMQTLVAPQCVNDKKIAMILREMEKEIPELLENERVNETNHLSHSFSFN